MTNHAHLLEGHIAGLPAHLNQVRVEFWQPDWPVRVLPVDVPLDSLDDLPSQVRQRLSERHIGMARVDEDGKFSMTTHRDVGEKSLFYRLFSADAYLGSGEVTPTPEADEEPGRTDALRRLSVVVPASNDDGRWPVPPVAIGVAVVLAGAVGVGWWAFGGDETDSTPDDGFAPPLDRTVASGIGESTQFLYTGEDPVQKGVDPDTIEYGRAAVLRGRVTDRNGSPLSGIRVSVVDHPEYGWTKTREGGVFDMAVNGGGQLTLRYEHEEYHVAQRSVQPPVRQFTWSPEVAVTSDQSEPTAVKMDADELQVATGAEVEDNAGSRQSTVMIPPKTGATISRGDAERTPDELSLQVTEYTVGPRGPEAMVDRLPPTVGYTYAAEIGVAGESDLPDPDSVERQSSGVNAFSFRTRPFLPPAAVERPTQALASVEFDQPVLNYVENFLAFPVGSIVPSGFYDYSSGGWVPSRNGRVVEVVDTSGRLASVDVDGDGNPSSDQRLADLGITDAERRELASRYEAGTTLWRVPLPHLTFWDHNWPFGPPQDAAPPDVRLASPPPTVEAACRI